uniref:Uncharacterized protein n=1 Tax=Spongospora subterranea TaxID=70186 RepID=A0A0H5R2V7_9EUKA|eukprot:CRZ08276.1 hypothetical protein [Spongospora subterranea]
MSPDKTIILSSSITSVNGHVSIQTEFMKTRACDLESSMQTDSVHGFVQDIHFEEVNVTFTSAYCPIIQRTIPLVISIMFGKSQYHYKAHFLVLLQSFAFHNLDEFLEGFPGMTCDFSDAERVGFELAIRDHFMIPEFQPLPLEKIYRFCEVHFKRSLTRVRRNGAIVSPEKEMSFYVKALELLSPDHSNASFHQLAKELQREYPKIKKWLAWYLHPARGKFIFPALLSIPANGSISKDTNAQESLGGVFQRAAPKKNYQSPKCSTIQFGLCKTSKWTTSVLQGVCQYVINPVRRGRSFSKMMVELRILQKSLLSQVKLMEGHQVLAIKFLS